MLPKEVDQVIPEYLLPNEIFSKPFKEIPESVQSGSYCSCSPCEIVTCFELRNQKSNLSCTCSMCKNPDTCANFSKNISDKQSNSKRINDTNIQNDIEQIEKELCSEITKVTNAEHDNREYTKFSCKDVLLKRNKIDWNIKNKSHDNSTTRQYTHSVAINYLPNERKNSTAKLSAAIMNMPYQDFKDSLSIENSKKISSPIDIKYYPSIENFRKSSFTPPKSSFDFKDILKPDFLTRLKEIYDACSCKVCECITGTSLPISSNECNCKPCDCNECTNNMKTQKKYVKQIPHDGCPCVSCDRKDCRGVVKKKDEISCSCVPCDCVKCTEDFTTSCDCEPCQCIECKALGTSLLRTFVVAPLHENIQHNVCQCEPCECMNCTHNYSSMASSLRRQVSTEIISNRNCRCDGCLNDTCQLNSEDCRCDMQSKIMKKPIERASRDYDIHSTLISCQKGKSKFNNDTIVTFALCNNNYCKTISYSHSKVNDCYCSNCECLVCKEKEEYKEDSRRIHSEILNKCSKPFLESFDTCKCSPCECQICSKCNKHANTLKEKCFKTSCECNKCHCFICKGTLNINNESCSQNKITGSLFSDTNTISCEKPYFSRKGKILIPSTFEANKDVTSQQQSLTHMSEHSLKRKPKKMSYFNVPEYKSSNKKTSRHQTVTACHTESKHNNIDEVYDKVIKCENSKFSANNIIFNDCFPNEDSNMADEVYVLKKSTTLSENGANNKLCEIFNANNKNPISDIGLLDTIIHLTKSLSKTDISLNKFVLNSENVTKHKYSDESDEKCLFDRKVPCIPITPKESVHTILLSTMDIEDNNFDEKHNFERLHTVSSRTFILCDKKSSSMANNRNNLQNMDRINSNNNYFESDLKKARDIIHTDSMSYIVKSLTDDLSDIVDLKSHTSNNDLKVRDMGTTVAKSITKLVKYNTYKSTIKCIGKKYNKMYTKLNKMKQIKDKIKVDEKNVKVLEPTENVLSACVGIDICSINDNNIESLEYSVNKRKDSDLQTTDSLTMTPYDKLFTSKNVLQNIMETQTQNIDLGDNTETWSIMRKNLYLNSSFVTKIKDVSTIPTMDFDNKIFLKSTSMQTSEFDNKIEKSTGKHALKKMDSELKNACSDAMSQTRANCSPIDKETYCNLIQSKGFYQRNTKLVMDNVLTKAAFESEHLPTERNFVQGYKQNLPKINSCKSSCHGLKATFVCLRTISDHTLMVKWRLPREIAYVQGYELQVDGRSVQKIFSPTRCMAILTCLPHSEKLLLTIRTLTTSSIPSDHQPATTIVYRPRVKC
ncbi:unnamed protein product [Euphydryas editha]|uniref:Uncharacterized protein n=1 Tax=Euphydryas editha TaxID=104508 RepID=A0AAU9TC28_EUPED|nr:unnamed protein product [Euphydryas editha]